jgi:hypothetical protein
MGAEGEIMRLFGSSSIPFALAVAISLATPPLKAADCNRNDVEDDRDISDGTSLDCNSNGVPDECDLTSGLDFAGAKAALVANDVGRGSFAAADLDGDGKLDVAVAVPRDESVAILVNGGKGALVKESSLHVEQARILEPQAVIAFDVEGDNDPDLAVVNKRGASVSFWRNIGGLGFEHGAELPVGQEPLSTIASDLDGDGDLDLAVANSSVQSNSISVLRNNGDGSFGSPEDYQAGVAPGVIVAADLEGDGTMDLAVTNGSSATDGIVVFRNEGAGTFKTAEMIAVGSFQLGLAAADLNGDRKVDLAVATKNGLVVLQNNGQGNFSLVEGSLHGTRTVLVIGGDVDADEDVDLIVAHSETESSRPVLSVLRNNGDGSFRLREDYSSAVQALLGDFNGDGSPDLVLATSPAVSPGTSNVSVLPNLGDGVFQSTASIPVQEGTSLLKAGDLDSDGDQDLVGNSFSGGLWRLLILGNDGTGIFSKVEEPFLGFRPQEEPNDFVLTDLNGDARTDVAVAENTDRLAIFLNKGNGQLESPKYIDQDTEQGSIVAADLDADGDQDLAILLGGAVGVLLNDGTGSFADVAQYPTSPNGACLLTLDLEGDGFVDLVLVTNTSLATTLSILRNKGDGTFERPRELDIGEQPACVAGADLDADGHDDLIVTLRDSTNLSLLWNEGNGSPMTRSSIAAGERLKFVTAADVDGDSHLDLVGADWEGSAVLVLRNQGRREIMPALRLAVGFLPGLVVVADINGDKRLDLACANESSHDISLLINKASLGASADCNANSIPDECDIKSGTEEDQDRNGVPDACEARPAFHRGDANGDGVMDISDGLCVLAFLFDGGSDFRCREAADANNDGKLDCSDSIVILGYLFVGTRPPVEPGPPPLPCGPDTDALGSPADLACESYTHCQ